MKRFLIVCIALISFGAQAQKWGPTEADSIRCFENYNNFGSLCNSKEYLQAYEPWLMVYTTCPQASEVVYKFAPKIFDAKIKAETDPAKKQALIDALMGMYDDWNRYYPGNEAKILGQKANDYYDYHPKDSYKAFTMFNAALAVNPGDIQPLYLNNYFNAAIALYKVDTLDSEGLLNAYGAVGEAIEMQTDNWNREISTLTEKDTLGTISAREKRVLDIDKRLLEQSNKLIGNIERGLAPLLTCDRLGLIYNQDNFDKHAGDASWLRRAEKMLSKERTDTAGTSDCTDNPIYYQVAQSLYDLEPSAQAARSMGVLSIKNEKYDDALKYFTDAIAQEADPLKKSRDYLRLAAIHLKLGNLAAAKGDCSNAIRANENSGEAYLMWANVYASAAGSCGNNVFEKNAVYWAAIDKANRAKSVDSSIAGRADKTIAKLRAGIPDKSISFQFGYKEGDRYSIGCWINETVTVRF
jgi:tetratricopeptide (TPR) repeat protein